MNRNRGREEVASLCVSINVRVGSVCKAGREAGVQEEPHIRGNSPVLWPHKSLSHTENCDPPPPLWLFCLSEAVRQYLLTS